MNMKLGKTVCYPVVICAFAFAMMSCQSSRDRNSQTVVTERQECFLKYFEHLPGQIDTLTIGIDVPVKGSRQVIDSITVFLNQTLYAFFDDGEDCHLPYEQVYSKNVRKLASHYREAYAPLFMTDGKDFHEFGSDCLEIGLAAQTDTYVTYEIDHIFFGEGLEVAKEWVTFVKSDGRRLKEVISGAGLLRFYKDCPEYRNEDIWRDVCFYAPDSTDVRKIEGTTGLLPDSVEHQYLYAPGIFEDVSYPLEAIGPYLSQEALALIK